MYKGVQTVYPKNTPKIHNTKIDEKIMGKITKSFSKINVGLNHLTYQEFLRITNQLTGKILCINAKCKIKHQNQLLTETSSG